MEGMGARRQFSDLQYLDYSNSHSGSKPDNRLYLVLAYQGLALCFNTTTPLEDLPAGPENTLDPAFMAQGWSGAFRPRGKPWL